MAVVLRVVTLQPRTRSGPWGGESPSVWLGHAGSGWPKPLADPSLAKRGSDTGFRAWSPGPARWHRLAPLSRGSVRLSGAQGQEGGGVGGSNVPALLLHAGHSCPGTRGREAATAALSNPGGHLWRNSLLRESQAHCWAPQGPLIPPSRLLFVGHPSVAPSGLPIPRSIRSSWFPPHSGYHVPPSALREP